MHTSDLHFKGVEVVEGATGNDIAFGKHSNIYADRERLRPSRSSGGETRG
jgi:hypothetical protein